MTKSTLQRSIEEAANQFALVIVDAIKSATLQDIVGLQESPTETPRRKPGPKPGRKPGRKPGPKPGRKPGRKPGPKPGRKTAASKVVAAKSAPKKKKRIVKNYPKCAYPGCNNNRFPRGKGFCGEHWRAWQAGKIKDADSYK